MPRIPDEKPDFEPGIYLAEIDVCREKTSKSGNDMFVVDWTAVHWHKPLCRDYIVFSKSAAGMTKQKLSALGYNVGDDVQASELIGARAWLVIHNEEFNGTTSCKVKATSEEGCRAGYWPEGELPEACEAWVQKPADGVQQQKAESDDAAPF